MCPKLFPMNFFWILKREGYAFYMLLKFLIYTYFLRSY